MARPPGFLTESQRNAVWRCPDGGYCHHACLNACFRVRNCGPLSDVFPNDDWPEHVQAFHSAVPLEESEPLYETDSAASLEATAMALTEPVEHYDGNPDVEHRDIRTMTPRDMPTTLDQVAGHDLTEGNGHTS